MAADGSIHELSFRKQAEIVCGKFAMGDTKLSIKYSLAGVADRAMYVHVSEAAFHKLKSEAPEILSAEGVKHRGSYAKWKLRIEHVIPTEIVYNEFSCRQRKGKLTVSSVERLIRDRLFCAVITEEEDKKLSSVGLKQRMPEGWRFDIGDVFARYIAAGIKMHHCKQSVSGTR